MRFGFYLKFAVGGMRRNKRLYVPYLLASTGMVAMFNIVYALSQTTNFDKMPGGGFLQSMLGLGAGVIGFFSLIFLFYTNSFLIRRRDREFGLYNVLGMGKRELVRVLFWQTLIIAVTSLGCGLLLGALLYKFFELGMVNLAGGEVTYAINVSQSAIKSTLLLFGIIFVLIFLNSLRKLHTSSATELLRSENAGEKPPKANWVGGALGLVILVAAYTIAVRIDNPLDALLWFFAAVLLVIVATYLIFIAGSVAMCRLMQKSKRYYYNAKHFVSVSSMAYRMKRNGAGLASICILLTMVLVMIASTACLYFGAENALRSRYPRNIILELRPEEPEGLSDAAVQTYRDLAQETLKKENVQPESLMEYRSAYLTGMLENGVLRYDASELERFSPSAYSGVTTVYFIPLSDYNRMSGETITLAQGEALAYGYRMRYNEPSFSVVGTQVSYRIVQTLDTFPVPDGSAVASVLPSLYLVVPDFDAAIVPLSKLADYNGERALGMHWFYGFDLAQDARTHLAVYNGMRQAVRDASINLGDSALNSYSISCAEAEREEFYGMFGGLFFLGILLSIVFLTAAVLIIYYKQISEGYEDQSRFTIMRKVGMTAREVRRSINSQMLSVFFLPIGFAGLHLCFAFPMLQKMLLMFSLTDVRFLALCTITCLLVFSVFYLIVYRLTSNSYYAIVSGLRKTE